MGAEDRRQNQTTTNSLPPAGFWLGQFLPTRSKDDTSAADPHCIPIKISK
jgi:hypothetical protein